MSKRAKIILGIFSIWPIVYMVLFFVSVVSMISFSQEGPGQATVFDLAILFLMVAMHIATIISLFVLLFIYIRHVSNNPALSKDAKPLWYLMLFFGNLVAIPTYWYFYIWKDTTDKEIQNDPSSHASV